MKIIAPKVRTDESRMEVLKPSKNKFCITTQNGHIIIKKSEITHLVADSNYTTIFFNNDKVLCARTMSFILGKLSHPNFVRIHKSHAINIDCMRLVDPSFSIVKLVNGVQLAIARSQKQALKNLIKYKFD